MNTCRNCENKFSLEDGGFVWDGLVFCELCDPKETMKTIILYIFALTGIMLLSWEIQEIHLGWGYTLGVAGLIVAFFVAVNALTKESRK
jgi:hypothetical protein